MENLKAHDVSRLIGALVGGLVRGGVAEKEIREALKAWSRDHFITAVFEELNRVAKLVE